MNGKNMICLFRVVQFGVRAGTPAETCDHRPAGAEAEKLQPTRTTCVVDGLDGASGPAERMAHPLP